MRLRGGLEPRPDSGGDAAEDEPTTAYTGKLRTDVLDHLAGKKLVTAPYIVNGDEFTIYTAADWDAFCDLLAGGEGLSGKTVRLGADITVTSMAGSSGHDFRGTFDGQGHTLTVRYDTSAQKAAPFPNVHSGCVIENLRVAGTIATTAKNAAGIVGAQYGTVTLRNCRSSVTILSGVVGDGTHGGLVSYKGHDATDSLTIEGCVFDGKILSTGDGPTTNCGGFVGSGDGYLTIRNCLYAPADAADGETAVNDENSATLSRNGGTITNCYYTQALGTAQGTQARSITADEYTTAAIAGTASQSYGTSGLDFYSAGIRCGDRLYARSGDSVSLTLGHGERPGHEFTGYMTDGGTLTGSSNPYALVMPDADVTVSATWREVISYIDYGADGRRIDTPGTCTDFTPVTDAEGDTQWGTGGGDAAWYVARGPVTIGGRVTVGGDVRLILCDGAELSVEGGIEVADGSSLAVYAQSEGGSMGSLYADAASMEGAAGIGGSGRTAGTVTVNGGRVTAKGGPEGSGDGNGGAGIGGGEGDGGGTVTVNGGVVEATGGYGGAGIGGGYNGPGGEVTVNGGEVTAVARSAKDKSGAGIGGGCGGRGGTVTINGGKVTAKGGNSGAGIGGGYEGRSGTVTINGGKVTAKGGNSGAGIGTGYKNGGGPDFNGGTVTVNGGEVEAIGGNLGAGIGGGYDGTGGDVTVTGGTVTANGGGNSAGIGSGGTSSSGKHSGTVTISGGTVTATGDGYGAGIGGGGHDGGYGGTVTISGGTVVATGGAAGGAGIGGSIYGTGGDVTVTGGTVTAEGGGGGAGIGAGKGGLGQIDGGTLWLSLGDTDSLAASSYSNDTGSYATVRVGRQGSAETEYVKVEGGTAFYTGELGTGELDGLAGQRLVGASPHRVTVAEADGGTVTAAPALAEAGATVTLTATPADGFALDGLTVTKDGTSPAEEVPLSGSGNERTFQMPDADVTVSATWMATAQAPKFVGRQLVLSGQIGMYLFMTIPDEFVEGSSMLPLI